MKSNQRNDRDSVRRVRPKKGFAKFLRGKVKTFNAHINEFEDDTASSTVVRWLVVVLLLHLIFIGGASLHGFLVKNRNSATADVPAGTHAASSSVPQQASVVPVAEQPAPVITAQAGGMSEAAIAQPVENIPVAQPVQTKPEQPKQPAPAVQQPVKAGSMRHLVATGDTWESIARDNKCTVGSLKTVNPGAKLTSGTNLVIPMTAEEMTKAVAEVVTGEESGEQVYVIKKGDTLSKVAREFKTSVDKIQKYNNITNPKKIGIGQEIRIPAN